MADRTPRNKNRLDLYRRLLPRIIEEDQRSNAQGYSYHWDDPDGAWDETLLSDDDPIWRAWDQIGLSPVYQELFHVIETMAGEDLEALETLDAHIDPFRCPEDVLPQIAASFGYALDTSQSEQRKRLAVQGLTEAFKSRGTFIGFKVFYRLLGFEIINVFPLWKKNINEERNDYERVRFATTPITAEAVGPAGNTAYVGQLTDGPPKPGSVRFISGTTVVRDNVLVNPEVIDDARGRGELIGPNGETGTIQYSTGAFTLNYPAATAVPVTVDYERVDEEWPYHAARIDVEINLSPGGVAVPLVDVEVTDNILRRLDEVRPIHVILRALAFIVELRDDVGPTASDRTACTTKLKNVLSGQPFPGILGLDHTYMLDGATTFASYPGEDELSIVEDYLVGTDIRHQPMEERAPMVCPLDTLTVDGPPGGPVYA